MKSVKIVTEKRYFSKGTCVVTCNSLTVEYDYKPSVHDSVGCDNEGDVRTDFL